MDTPTRSRMALSANISNTASHLAGKKTGSRWSPLPMTNASDYLLCSSLSLLLSCDRSIHEWQSFPAERRRREASLPRLCKCLISLYPSVPSDDASQTMRHGFASCREEDGKPLVSWSGLSSFTAFNSVSNTSFCNSVNLCVISLARICKSSNTRIFTCSSCSVSPL